MQILYIVSTSRLFNHLELSFNCADPIEFLHITR